jgi:maleylacetoacetate isomerase
MALTLYGYWRSSAAYRARIALALKGLDYTNIPINLRAGGQSDASYRAVNPQRKVPTLVDDDFILPQSLAIIEYLEESKPEPSLLPATVRDRAVARSMAEMIACDIHPLNNVAVLRYLKKQFGCEDDAIRVWYHHWLEEGLGAVEAMLKRHKQPGRFAFEDRPTIVEIFLAPQVVNARVWNYSLEPYPLISGIDAECQKLDAFTMSAPSGQPDAPPDATD